MIMAYFYDNDLFAGIYIDGLVCFVRSLMERSLIERT